MTEYRVDALAQAAGVTVDEQEAERLVAAFRLMVQAANGLISYNIERMTLNLVEEELERLGTGAELEALQREVSGRRLDAGVPA